MSGPTTKKEAFSRVLIDKQLLDVGWNLTDGVSVRYEYQLPDGTFADYVLCDRNGRSLAVIEAKRHSKSPRHGERQGRAYAEQLKVPYVFLANGEEVLFWDYHSEAHPRPVAGFFSQADLERRAARGQLRVDPLSKSIDRRIVERDYQINCIDALCREINNGRRKLLVEMATGTGKTRTAAALFKRLFDANVVTRVLFLVDRITLAKQTEDAFAEHLPDLPCYVLRTGRRFQDEKLVTITTLQSMINLYRDYSPGYFDLIVTDECHRSIYGQWSGILKYFDGIQIGLTATPFTSEIGTGDEEDKLFVRDTLRFFEVKEPTFRYTLREAIEDQHLVPYQIYKAKTVKTASQGGFKVKKSELDWSAMSTKEKQEFEALFKEKDTITVDPNALERRFTIPARNLAMVQEFRQVLENGYQDKKDALRKPGLGKTIVFAVTKRHAETLANLFDTAFADQKPSKEIRFVQAEALLQSLMARFFCGEVDAVTVPPGVVGADGVLPGRMPCAPPQDLLIAAEAPAAYTAGGQATLPAANQPVPARILAAMSLGRDYSRTELLAATGISAGDWTGAIRQLKEEGRVIQAGEKRGARYVIAGE